MSGGPFSSSTEAVAPMRAANSRWAELKVTGTFTFAEFLPGRLKAGGNAPRSFRDESGHRKH